MAQEKYERLKLKLYKIFALEYQLLAQEISEPSINLDNFSDRLFQHATLIECLANSQKELIDYDNAYEKLALQTSTWLEAYSDDSYPLDVCTTWLEDSSVYPLTTRDYIDYGKIGDDFFYRMAQFIEQTTQWRLHTFNLNTQLSRFDRTIKVFIVLLNSAYKNFSPEKQHELRDILSKISIIFSKVGPSQKKNLEHEMCNCMGKLAPPQRFSFWHRMAYNPIFELAASIILFMSSVLVIGLAFAQDLGSEITMGIIGFIGVTLGCISIEHARQRFKAAQVVAEENAPLHEDLRQEFARLGALLDKNPFDKHKRLEEAPMRASQPVFNV